VVTARRRGVGCLELELELRVETHRHTGDTRMKRLVRVLERGAEASTHSASDASGWGHQLLD